MSACSAACLGVAATVAPFVERFAAGWVERFHTVRPYPALMKLVAMREPIAPRPKTAIFGVFMVVYSLLGETLCVLYLLRKTP